MGFLDMFDNPNIMQSLLGIPGTDGGQQPPMPPPPSPGGIGSDYASSQPPPPAATGMPIGDPGGGVSLLPGNLSFPSGDATGGAPPLPPPQSVGYAPGAAPQIPMPQPRPDMGAGVPMPQPNPLRATGGPMGGPGAGNTDPGEGPAPDFYNGPGSQNAGQPVAPGAALGLAPPAPGGALPPNAAPTGFSPPGRPLSLAPNGAPPMPPNAAPGTAPPSSLSGGGLAGALGLTDPNTIRQIAAGVGKGLSAVGQLRPGATAGQAIAAGAGGALTGVEQQRQQMFTQSSTAFKDMLAAKSNDDNAGYKAAQAQYLAARAQSLMTGGTANGSRAWQNTPYGKTIQVENNAQKYENGQRILLQKQWQLNGTAPDQQQQDLNNLNKNVDAYRQRLYRQIGIDPNQADKLKNMGTSKDNAFDTKGMSLDQFHQMVPMGAWFKDQNGVVRQRTVAPPGTGTAPAAAPGQGAANYYDDQTAMTPAA